MSTQTHKVRWLLYHEPVDLFLRTANSFAKEIKQLTDGRIDIEIYTPKEYCDKFHGGTMMDPTALIKSGEVQMSQTQVSYLGVWGAEDFYALELPFLFTSHEHATRVLEGEIGQNLLNNLAEKTPVRGLAFTYSGGFRCMASKTPVVSAEQFAGLEMSVKSNPVFADMARAFGCKIVPAVEHEWDHNQVIRDGADLVQTTLPRYQSECDNNTHGYVINSRHSMYLTSIIVGEQFWSSLSVGDQQAMRQAALNSARLERQWTVDDSTKIENNVSEQAKLGIKQLIELDSAETEKLQQAVGTLYEKYDGIFSSGLLDNIRKA